MDRSGKYTVTRNLSYYFGTDRPKCPTELKAEFIKFDIPLRNPGEPIDVPKTAAAAAGAFTYAFWYCWFAHVLAAAAAAAAAATADVVEFTLVDDCPEWYPERGDDILELDDWPPREYALNWDFLINFFFRC